jgi:succinate-acetate transporter protein
VIRVDRSRLGPILIIINHYQQKKRQKAKAKANFRIAILLALFALVAFTAWACALPETPFLVFTPLAVKIGAVAVLVLAAVLTPLADLLGILPKR